ncbi:hypothetical protein CsSME_00001342 [Camellia sinensis var. sinensis]
MLSIKRSRLASVSEASHHHHYHLALSADTIASNADLLTKTLLHLPIRLLFRFKSVSKHWLSLITHTYFSHCHQILNRHRFWPIPTVAPLVPTQQPRI